MEKSQKPVARREGIIVQEMPDEVLIYNLQTNKAHCLNKTAAAVWQNCDGNNTVSDISLILKREFKSPVTEDFVWLAIDQLNRDDLLMQKLSSPTSGLSRREVMRRVSIASIIALPIISSIAAPSVYAANTCTVTAGGACTTTGGAPCCDPTVNPPLTCCTTGPNAGTCQATC